MNSRRITIVLMFLGLAPLLVGCGKRTGVDRLPVHGTVKLANGEKFSGFINFRPAQGRPGPAATTKLSEGSYAFDRSNGPTAGPQVVTVQQIISRSSMLQSIADKQAALKTKPPRTSAATKQVMSNAKTEWNDTADVADDGQYLHDFILKD